MKREEVLKRLGYTVPDIKKKRVIISSDIATEADDPFAIVHHLLTPSEDVVGIIAANFEWKYRTYPQLKEGAERSVEQSYQMGKKILELMEMDDIPLVRGAEDYIIDRAHLPESEGADFIIREAMKESDEPLYIALQAHMTDLAIAYLKEPKIAEKITAAIWIGGAAYPEGGDEPNLREDVYAAQVVFNSAITLWQIPANVYAKSYLSFAELMTKIKPYGHIGQFLSDIMLQVNDMYGNIPVRMPFPHGEVWSIGDQPTITVLLQSETGSEFHTEYVKLQDDMTYELGMRGKAVRVYDAVDMRLTMEDLFSKLKLCYGEK